MPFDGPAAATYGPIGKATRDSKKDHLDKLIAANAASPGVIVVTNDVKDFVKCPGVVSEC